jgi:hypothetical protein
MGDFWHLLEGVHGVRLGSHFTYGSVDIFLCEYWIEDDVENEPAHCHSEQVKAVVLGELPREEAVLLMILLLLGLKMVGKISYSIRWKRINLDGNILETVGKW